MNQLKQNQNQIITGRPKAVNICNDTSRRPTINIFPITGSFKFDICTYDRGSIIN